MVDSLNRGDRIVCKVRESAIVEAYTKDFDEKRVFEIIGTSYQGWYLYVPSYIVIKGSSLITKKNYQSLGINAKYIGEETVFITSSFVVKVEQILTGMLCKSCGEHFDYAEPNQPDGTLVCWYCRRYPFYK